MTAFTVLFLLPYTAIGMLTYVVFARLDEKMYEEHQQPTFPKYAGMFWPLTWITFGIAYVFAVIVLRGDGDDE